MTSPTSDTADNPTLMLAAILHPGGDEFDRLIARIAERLRRKGHCVGGVTQSNVGRSDGCRCDMWLEELVNGRKYLISQELGSQARGCRLDGSVLERVVLQVETSLRAGIDVLVLNKFGKQEAGGRGMRQAIAQALAANIPVLVGLNHDYATEWDQFCGGEGRIFAPDEAVINAWLDERLSGTRERDTT